MIGCRMDPGMREALRKCRVELLENIIMNELMDYLIVQDIFSDAMLERIKAGRTNREQVRMMLDELGRRPHSCFDKFLTALRDSSQAHCAEIVLASYKPSTSVSLRFPVQASSDEELLRNPWPVRQVAGPCAALPDHLQKSIPITKAPQESMPRPVVGGGNNPGNSRSVESLDSCFLRTWRQLSKSQQSNCNGDNISDFQWTHLSSVNQSKYIMDSVLQQVYPMNTYPRGLALVINVEEFVNMPRREGSKADMHRLHELFQFLGIQACHKLNCKVDEIHQYLKTFSEHDDLRNVCCLVVVILSHGGNNGAIYGSDGKVLRDDDVRSYFSISKCPLMANKPKLILIQACRGDQEDCVSSTLSTSDCPLMQENGLSLSSNSTSSSRRTADMADICLIHSTLSGYVSYRHPEDGSPFINVFCSEMKTCAATEHLTDIMIKVNRVMATSHLPGDLRTLPSSTNTLTRKWYFNPPCNSTPTSL